MGIRLTEKKSIKIGCVPDNPIYLRWWGLVGQNYWCFGGTQTEQIDVSAEKEQDKYVQDWATTNSRSEYISKRAFRRQVLGYNNLTTQEVQGIKTILMAIKVEALIDVDTNKWQTVKVLPGTWATIETENARHDLEFTIEYPELNIPRQ